MPLTMRTIATDRGDARRRLDLVLRRHLGDVQVASRSRIQGWIESGHVTVNGALVRRAAARAAPGDIVTILLPGPRRAAMAPEEAALTILYEDDHFLAIDKPAGMVVHPAYGHPAGTLMNALLWHARSWPTGCRPTLVGRLDKLTSGVVIVAKSSAVHAALQKRDLEDKTYLAVVYGNVAPARGQIDLRIGHDRRDRRRMVASAELGAPSLTRFERLARVAAPRAGLSLLRCRLVTGRTHQIRVHLAARGWPIVGDSVYGESRWTRVADAALATFLSGFPRQALHAWRVGLTHPVTRRRLVIEAPVPDDLGQLIAVCGLAPRAGPAIGDVIAVQPR